MHTARLACVWQQQRRTAFREALHTTDAACVQSKVALGAALLPWSRWQRAPLQQQRMGCQHPPPMLLRALQHHPLPQPLGWLHPAP